MDSTIYIDIIINSIFIMFLILFLLIIITNFIDIILDNQLISLNTIEKDNVTDGSTVIDDEENDEEESDSDEVEEQEEGEQEEREQEEWEQEEWEQGEEEQGEEEQGEEDEILTEEMDAEELIIDSDEDDMNEINSEMMPLEVAGKSSESLSDEEDRIVGHKVNRFFTHTISNLLKIRLSREKRMRLDKVE